MSNIGFRTELEEKDKVKTDTTETFTHNVKIFGIIPLLSITKKHIIDSQQIGKI